MHTVNCIRTVYRMSGPWTVQSTIIMMPERYSMTLHQFFFSFIFILSVYFIYIYICVCVDYFFFLSFLIFCFRCSFPIKIFHTVESKAYSSTLSTRNTNTQHFVPVVTIFLFSSSSSCICV